MKKARLLIQEALASDSLVLDLSGLGLTELPPEIVQLTQLHALGLGSNKLTQLPPEIVQLTQLQRLNLTSNQLTQLPPEITQLTQLQTLNLSDNHLTKPPSEIAQLTQLQRLYLWDNPLIGLPPEILRFLENLLAVYVDSEVLPGLGRFVRNLELGLKGQLKKLLPEITQLTQLQKLYLWDNQLTEFPTEIAQLTQLQTLNLRDNQLTELPPEIAQLTQLRTLDLTSNHLTELPPEIAKLTQLQTLDLRYNQLTELPPEIAKLTQLQTLDLMSNQLTELPPEIAKLTQLQTLDLWNAHLTELPPEITKLTQLQTLDLMNNRLTELPPEIAKLTQLQTLDLRNNELTELPPEVAQLTQLQTLDLMNNQLTELPPEIGQLTQLQKLYLQGNGALLLPPEVLGPKPTNYGAVPADPAGILHFYFGAQRSARPLLEAKVLVVGQGGVGKTSLIKRLTENGFDPEEGRTEGIDIVRWQVASKKQSSEIRVNVWDFGGQEIMHATHQFFLTRRSVYLLVLDARKGENEGNLHYWLRIIQSFGGNAPVLVVTNKVEPPNLLELNETRLSKDYSPNTVGFFRTSCLTGEGISELLTAIVQQINELEHIYDTVPKAFLDTKDDLERETEAKDFLELQEFESLCKQHGVERRLDQTLLLRFLHDLGSVLHFSDPDSPYRLEETKILNPSWVTNGVYKILNSPSLSETEGVMTLPHLGQILTRQDGYPKQARLFILGMMRKFELCFDFTDGSNRFLVPELLSRNEPESLPFAEDAALNFEIHYAVLPEGILPRFIVRMHEHLAPQQTSWRSGAVLEIDGNLAIVRADIQKARMFLSVAGAASDRRRTLTALRVAFESIHRTVPGIEAEERVPIPGHPGVSVSYEHLLRMEASGRKEIWPEGAADPHDIGLLLDGIETKRGRRERHPSIHVENVNVFQGDVARDKYAIQQADAVGPFARAGGNVFQQIFEQHGQELNLEVLAEELTKLRGALLKAASEDEQLDMDPVTAVIEARKAALSGNGSEALKSLSTVGGWALDTATAIGVRVAAKAIELAALAGGTGA